MNTDRFKFRAWSIEEKKYYLDIEYTYADDYKNCSFVPNTQNVDEHYNFGGILDDPGYIVEQCTGLKDKNGKLIFEGDIVQYNGKETGTVIFRKGCFVWDWKVNDPAIYGLEEKEFEIIGNVHDKEG